LASIKAKLLSNEGKPTGLNETNLISNHSKQTTNKIKTNKLKDNKNNQY
jgi:hypothetical protein